MSRLSRLIVGLSAVGTLVTLTVWLSTGRHYFTKFSVVERVETQIDPSDPLAQAGFYDHSSRTQTVQRDEFHLGLLPVPQGLFDKHAVSVVSITLPMLGISALFLWRAGRRGRAQPTPSNQLY